MKPIRGSREPPDPGRHARAGRVAEACCSIAGIGGSVACSFGMVAAAVGLFGTAGTTAARGASMAGMGDASSTVSRQPGWLDALVRFGPEILIASLALVALGVGLRRPRALIAVAVGGGVLYVGMYVQDSLATMYVAIAAGTILLIFAYAWSLRMV